MKRLLLTLSVLAPFVHASESALTVTYQPLDGLGSGGIHIFQVVCHDWYSNDPVSSIGLISARNIPPTNQPKKATEDLNLASVCGLRFEASDLGDPRAALELTLDATKFAIPARFGYPRETIVRSCFECLRLCLPGKLLTTPVTLKCADTDRDWLMKIVAEFNAHDRTTVFYTPPS